MTLVLRTLAAVALVTAAAACDRQPTTRSPAGGRADARTSSSTSTSTSMTTVTTNANAPAPLEPWDPSSITSTTTITSYDHVPATPPPPEALPAPNDPKHNASTTLGHGNSGMYTGGLGTYGGRATWGTGVGTR